MVLEGNRLAHVAQGGRPPGAILRLFFLEGAMVASFAAILGCVTAILLFEITIVMLPGDAPLARASAADLAVALASVCVLASTAVASAVLPAYRAARTSPAQTVSKYSMSVPPLRTRW